MSKKSELQWQCLEMEKYRNRFTKLKPGFLRPLYQYTSQENATVAELHEEDYKKDLERWRG